MDTTARAYSIFQLLFTPLFHRQLLFAFVPPTEYFGGWACFVVSIIGIGLLTAVIGDVASHFGCTINLNDEVTAVTLVAMGTSVPGEFTLLSMSQLLKIYGQLCTGHDHAVHAPKAAGKD